MQATSIDEVLAALTVIIDDARAKASRIGYFAALYRRVTQSVKDGIAAGRFQNGSLMEHLDIVFANRYLDALAEFQAGRQPMRSWAVALEASTNRFPLILQQLLVAISAHINLDLGIATAAVAPGDQLPEIQADFDQINGVLAAIVGTVERKIGEVSPGIHLLEQVGLRSETCIINFDMEKARDLAWHTAQHLAATPASQEAAAIELLDFKVAAFGQLLIHPPAPIALKLAPIRLPESDDIRHIIDVLANN